MSQHVVHSHAESVTNAVAGAAIAQLVLWAWGMPLGTAVALNVTMLIVSYLRAFIIRRAFDGWRPEREEESCADIARRMSLVMSGRESRKHASAKAKAKEEAKPDHGPLFGGSDGSNMVRRNNDDWPEDRIPSGRSHVAGKP